MRSRWCPVCRQHRCWGRCPCSKFAVWCFVRTGGGSWRSGKLADMRNAVSSTIGPMWAVGVVMAALLMTGVRTAQAEVVVAPSDGYGFSVGAPMTWMSDVEADRELDAAARTGATWLRVLIDWHL